MGILEDAYVLELQRAYQFLCDTIASGVGKADALKHFGLAVKIAQQALEGGNAVMNQSLKRVVIPGYGPFVFGRTPTIGATDQFLPSAPSRTEAAPANGILNALVQAAAKNLQPGIYGAEEDILGNDEYGDCTCAGILHNIAILQAITGKSWRIPTRADAVYLYSKVTVPPFDPATGANDNGADLLTVLKYVQTNGAYSDGSGKIKAFSIVDATRSGDLRAALAQNYVLYLGGDLPDAWIPTQSSNPATWDVMGPPNPENGHCIVGFGDNDNGVRINTWGEFKILTWAALAKYFAGSSGEVFTLELA